MNTRVNPFANLADPPVFSPKPRKEKPVEEEEITRISEQNNFPSRQAAKSSNAVRRNPRIYRTGRNQQFNAKATPETIQRFYKLADEKRVPLGEMLKQGIDALDAIGALSKLADTRNIPLQEIVKQAVAALDEAVSRQPKAS
jgi:hypothetical protein